MPPGLLAGELLHCMSPLLALSRHRLLRFERLRYVSPGAFARTVTGHTQSGAATVRSPAHRSSRGGASVRRLA